MKLYLDLDMEKCSACGACAVACMDQNDIDPTRQAPFRNVYCLDQCDSFAGGKKSADKQQIPLFG